MAISNPLRGQRKGGTVGKPFAGVQVSVSIIVCSYKRTNWVLLPYQIAFENCLISLVFDRQSSYQRMRMVMTKQGWASSASKALHCLKDTGNFLRYWAFLFYLFFFLALFIFGIWSSATEFEISVSRCHLIRLFSNVKCLLGYQRFIYQWWVFQDWRCC